MLTGNSVICASVSALLLGSFLTGVILLCKRYRINADNVASPLAGSLSDLTALVVLTFASKLVLRFESYALVVTVLVVIFGWAVLCARYCRNNGMKELMGTGWVPVISAVFLTR